MGTIDIEDVRRYIRDMMDERDRRYEQHFEAMDAKTTLALSASDKAVTKAEAATEKRFDTVNEFRATLSDQAGRLYSRAEAEAKFLAIEDKLSSIAAQSTKYVSRDTYDERHEELRRRIGVVENKASNMDGRLWMLGAALTAFVALLNLVSKYWK